jgi:hypothetical protein
MRKICLLVVVCAASLLFVPAAAAQELPKPGPEHALLKRAEGTWDATVKMGNTQSKGTMTYKMELGGLWLVSDFTAEFQGTKFQGKGLDTYDPARKKYINIWADAMSTAPMIMEGAYDKDGKVLTMTGEGPSMDGKMTKHRSVLEIKDADTMQFSLFTPGKDGKDRLILSITYERKK